MSATYDLTVTYHAPRGHRSGPEWYGFAHNDGSADFLAAAFAARADADDGYCDALCRVIDVSPHRTEEMVQWRYATRRAGRTLPLS